jgi:predicted transcriptional regulator of viral defense system
MALLLAVLHDKGQRLFTIADAVNITGLSAHSASTLLHKALQRGLLSQPKGGLFMIVPEGMGSQTEYAGSPYLIARRLAGENPCFLSHASAMEIHRMVTQPQLAIFASCSKRIQNRSIQGTDYRFVLIKPEHYFGTTKHWATKQEAVEVSDLERTVVDGLRHPEYCGGLTEVAKGLWMRHEDIKVDLLIDYAERLGVGAVTRRIGYLLELYELASPEQLQRLAQTLSATYALLEPSAGKTGPHLRRWRLQLNVSDQELIAVRDAA